MKLYYIWDAYCGWCYGFKEILNPFVKNHPELEIDVLSGGLFNQGNKISNYPHIPATNQQIAEIYQVTFGKPYAKLLSDGQFVMESNKVAAAFGVVKEFLPNHKWLEAASLLQDEFYQNGNSLSQIDTYLTIAKTLNISHDTFYQQINVALTEDSSYHKDFDKIQYFQAKSYPTLILEKDGKYYDLRSGAMTLAQLEDNFSKILNHQA